MKVINGQKRVGFAVLGLGIGMAHAEAISTSEQAYLVCGCDIDEKRLAKFAAKYPDAYTTASFDEVLADESVDVVSVCLPTYMHAEFACKALRAGKHVLCEKPADITVERAMTIKDAELESGKMAGFVFQNRYSYLMYPIFDAIRSGRLGKIYLGTFAVKWLRKQSYYDNNGGWRGTWDKDGGGSLMNQSIHTVDLMLQLMGSEVKDVRSVGGVINHDIEAEDMTASLITFENGATATFVSTTCAYDGLSTEIGVYGTKGSIEADADKLRRWRLSDDTDGIEEEELLDIYGMGNISAARNHPGVRCGHAYMIDDMANAVLSGRRPAIGIDDAVRSVALIERIYKCIRESK